MDLDGLRGFDIRGWRYESHEYRPERDGVSVTFCEGVCGDCCGV